MVADCVWQGKKRSSIADPSFGLHTARPTRSSTVDPGSEMRGQTTQSLNQAAWPNPRNEIATCGIPTTIRTASERGGRGR
eukprot:5679641-Alexandrium_andersonii.AAC.1